LVGFDLIFFGIIAATLVPAYIALYLVTNLRFLHTKYIAAAGIGLTFWFFFDTMGDADSLDVNSPVYPPGLFGGLSHIAVIAAFAAGIAALAIFDHYAVRPRGSSSSERAENVNQRSMLLLLIPVAVALVMGVHGLGEGWDAASAVATAPTNSTSISLVLVQAFGDVPAVVSYPLHKLLEASIVAAVYACYVVRSSGVVRAKWWHIPLLGLLFGGPSVVGAGLGYFVSFDTTYFYAFGVTSALYAALRLAEATRPNFKIGGDSPARLGSRIFLAMAIGFFLLYATALLH